MSLVCPCRLELGILTSALSDRAQTESVENEEKSRLREERIEEYIATEGPWTSQGTSDNANNAANSNYGTNENQAANGA